MVEWFGVRWSRSIWQLHSRLQSQQSLQLPSDKSPARLVLDWMILQPANHAIHVPSGGWFEYKGASLLETLQLVSSKSFFQELRLGRLLCSFRPCCQNTVHFVHQIVVANRHGQKRSEFFLMELSATEILTRRTSRFVFGSHGVVVTNDGNGKNPVGKIGRNDTDHHFVDFDWVTKISSAYL